MLSLNSVQCLLVYSAFVFLFKILFLMLIVNFNKGLFLLPIECFKENGDILNYKDLVSCIQLPVSSEKQRKPI